MRLSTRFSAYFLTALGLVLVGFSGTLYLLARHHLRRELEERLVRALDTLEASVDIERSMLPRFPMFQEIRRM